MQVSDGLKNFKCGILLPSFNFIHVAFIAADLVRHILTCQTLLHTQLCNDCSKGFLSCLSCALKGATHVTIITWLTLFCLSVITTKPMRGHDNNNMKTSKTFDVTEKARIYHTLAQMSSSFSSIVRYCEELELNGALTPGFKRLFQAFTVEVQAELNLQVLEHMDRIESSDWRTSGRVRDRWEKYLRTEPKKRTAKKSR
jgi:hypothetical protein